MAEVTWEPLCLHTRGWPRRISRQKFPKRTRILSIPSKPYSFHSVHSAVGSRMNGMIFRSFRKRNSSQKNTNTVYSEYSYSGIVPKERTLSISLVFERKQFLYWRNVSHFGTKKKHSETKQSETKTRIPPCIARTNYYYKPCYKLHNVIRLVALTILGI